MARYEMKDGKRELISATKRTAPADKPQQQAKPKPVRKPKPTKKDDPS